MGGEHYTFLSYVDNSEAAASWLTNDFMLYFAASS